jgi:hypothetical protein
MPIIPWLIETLAGQPPTKNKIMVGGHYDSFILFIFIGIIGMYRYYTYLNIIRIFYRYVSVMFLMNRNVTQ